MTRWTPPGRAPRTLALKAAANDDDERYVGNTEAKSRKEGILRRSLELATGERDNEDAVADIVSKEAHLFDLAMDAVLAFAPDSNDMLCWAFSRVFEDPRAWKHLNQQFADYSARKLLEANEARGAVYIGSHQPDLQSEALGYVGLYFLGLGDQKKSFDLWEAADDGYDVDEAIALVAQRAVWANAENLAGAIALVDLINTKTIRAKALSELSEYT